MKPSEYLDAAKTAIGVESDYALAKQMGERNAHFPGFRSGERAIPLKSAYWLAITLKIDPATVAADLEAQREKNPVAVKFWKSFLAKAAVSLLIISGGNETTLVSPSPADAGQVSNSDQYNVYYVK